MTSAKPYLSNIIKILLGYLEANEKTQICVSTYKKWPQTTVV